ncbi:MAG: aldehyde dehydrogenase family protein [Ilumatobacteraceae bacterium]
MSSGNPPHVLNASDRIVVGDKLLNVGEHLAATFVEGDRLIGIPNSNEILHVPRADTVLVEKCVTRAHLAFEALQLVGDESISLFFAEFAAQLSDEAVMGRIQDANDVDVRDAEARGRSTTRLVLSEQMRLDMIEALHIWQRSTDVRESVVERVEHGSWTVESVRAPLGVIGFVFEGRPNVFADATGVLRSGNTCVLRIGSDALRTASAIVEHAVRPALIGSGLPPDAIQLIDAKTHSAGWALFSDPRIALAVARGSGPAVTQLGAVARQAGIPVSLHGTGGAWLIAGEHADVDTFEAAVHHSLDRKVCNTLNVVCIPRARANDLLPAFERAVVAAASARDTTGVVHYVQDRMPLDFGHDGSLDLYELREDELSTEWEWEVRPECSVVVVENVAHAVSLCNRFSPQFVVSVLSTDNSEHRDVWQSINSPFVGNGMTRWVDGQFALLRPELGLSNWQFGRLLGRSGILSGDSAYTIRLRATQHSSSLHR